MPAAKLFGEPSRLIQMYSIANVCFCFEMAKEKAETFWVSAGKFNIKMEVISKYQQLYHFYQ